MADHSPAGPVELGAKMDYAEHEKTFARFVSLAKYGTLFCAALLIAMAFFFFATAGGAINFIFSVVLMVLVIAVGAFLLR